MLVSTLVLSRSKRRAGNIMLSCLPPKESKFLFRKTIQNLADKWVNGFDDVFNNLLYGKKDGQKAIFFNIAC